MLVRRIPENYDFELKALTEIIKTQLPGVPYEIKGRIVMIDAELTAQQKTNIKDAIIPLLTDVTDITQ